MIASRIHPFTWKLVLGAACFALAAGTAASQPLQVQADAAFDQAQQELRDTDALILFTREDASEDWTISITGLVAGVATDFEGVVNSIDETGAAPVLVTTPPVPVFTATADLCTPMLTAAALVLSDIDDYVTELYFDVSAPLEDSADPERFGGVDVETLPLYSMSQTTTLSSSFSLLRTTGALNTAESYLAVATDFGLEADAVKDLVAARLDEAAVAEAFRAGAINILGEAGISEQSASSVFDLRCSLGDTPAYYQQAFALLAGAGEPVQPLIADGAQLDDPEGPLAQVQNPADIEIELYGETEIEVSAPPFVKIKIKVGVKVRGKLSEYAELEEALRQHLATAAKAAKEEAERQLDVLKETIETMVEMFKNYLNNLQVPAWLHWLMR